MAGRGPAPKPAHLRQRTNKKSGASVLTIGPRSARQKIPTLPNHDQREWHSFTLMEWKSWWLSPMADKWIDSDFYGLYKLACLTDKYFKTDDIEALKEIRLQEPRFGLTPLDRSRLQWEIVRGDEAGTKKPAKPRPTSRPNRDPRAFLRDIHKKQAG